MIKNSSASSTTHEKSWLPWFIWSGAGFFYFYQYILRTSPSYMAEELMTSFKFQGLVLGILSAFYYYAYAPMQIPLGIILDRFGPRRVLLGSCFMCISGCLFFASSSSLSMACLGRLFMGIGSAGAWIGSIKLATFWFPPHRLGTVIGATMFLGTVGPFMGGPIFADVIDSVGWRSSMFMLGGIGVALLIYMIMMIKTHPLETEGQNIVTIPVHNSVSIFSTLKQLLISRNVWLNALYAMLMYVPMAVFADLWGVSYIQDLYYIDKSGAARIVSYVFFGVSIGALAVSYFSDQVGSRKLPMFIGAFGSLSVYTLIIYMPGISIPGMCCLIFLAGFFFTGQLMSFATAVEMVPVSSSGIVVGFTNMIIMLSGVVFEPLVGWLLDYNRRQAKDASYQKMLPTESFSLNDWKFALSSIIVCLSISFILVFFIQETHIRKRKTEQIFKDDNLKK